MLENKMKNYFEIAESKSQTFWQFKPTKHLHPDKIFVSKDHHFVGL